MRLTVQKRLAAQILGCSKKRVWVDPERLEEIREGITKQDVKGMISSGLIKGIPKKGVSRVRARFMQSQKRKGRHKGMGTRKGGFKARTPRKKSWMLKVRAQRNLLKELRSSGIINPKDCRMLLLRVKGGFFRSRRHIKLYLSEHNLLNIEKKKENVEKKEKVKETKKKAAPKPKKAKPAAKEDKEETKK